MKKPVYWFVAVRLPRGRKVHIYMFDKSKNARGFMKEAMLGGCEAIIGRQLARGAK